MIQHQNYWRIRSHYAGASTSLTREAKRVLQQLAEDSGTPTSDYLTDLIFSKASDVNGLTVVSSNPELQAEYARIRDEWANRLAAIALFREFDFAD